MIINEQNGARILAALSTSIKKVFDGAFASTESNYDKVAMTVPSTGASNTYAWTDRFPALRKWIGDKAVKKLTGHAYILVNEDYEGTVEVDRNDIEDDNLGMYTIETESVAESAKRWPDGLVFKVLTKGFSEKCYDGKTFYATDHKVGDGKSVETYSNKITAPLSAATLAEAQASLGAAITLMTSLKDSEGEPLNLSPSLLVVPPALRETANVLVTTDRLEDGKPNPYKNAVEVLVCGWLATTTEWHLLDASRKIKPIVFQPRKKPVFVAQFDMNSDNVFMRKKYRYGAEARGVAGFGLWQQAVGSTGTGA
ncbi:MULTISPECIES: Mu-like prophage major head subunit gpT family protein [Acinetobacter]|uniref:Head protein n=1 Tax=Acinetobacter soli TaxID=487316 RepID=A0A1P8EG68_9GAMM|nr:MULTISPECIES: Mu-like prophage major head subunit gpT family protein [Acinetobacter]APV35211.1 head protein [Acinetobacter soli]MBV6550065.1 Mu-like prophage major head subunit gpT family protein [Acinetobacter soli]MCL9676960.1 Mu-like prophage major head subunit gpT family protein [Acinetobacter sp. ACZLY 512]MDS7693804.1 Mu-like prophage major head subunit gpT family protein [Acinetobacter soli]